MRVISVAVICATICILNAFGQTPFSGTFSSKGGTAEFPLPAFAPALVTGEPYAADQTTELVQMLAGGTHVTHTSAVTKLYRDSLGRTRIERPMAGGVMLAAQIPNSPMLVEITDPPANSRYILDTVHKVAHRQPLPARQPTGEGLSPIAPPTGGNPQTVAQNLGAGTIEGIAVTGTRRTVTWPAGSRGNDRPLTVVNETWFSPDLKIVVLNKSDRPDSGEQTQKLTNLSRSEPDPSLFQPPADYSIVDEAGAFTITWSAQ